MDFNYEEFEQYEYEDDFDDEEVTACCRTAQCWQVVGGGCQEQFGLFQSVEMNLADFVLCKF